MAKKKASSDPTSTPGTSVPRTRRAAPRRTSSRTAQPSAAAGAAAEPLERAADAAAPAELPGAHLPSYEEIAEAAYHRFLQRGGGDGRDFDDWIEAERELRTGRRGPGA